MERNSDLEDVPLRLEAPTDLFISLSFERIILRDLVLRGALIDIQEFGRYSPRSNMPGWRNW